MNPVTADPAAHQVHQSPTYCVRGIDGSLPGCKGENWGSLAPIIPQISKQLHVDEWVPPVTFCLTSPGRVYESQDLVETYSSGVPHQELKLLLKMLGECQQKTQALNHVQSVQWKARSLGSEAQSASGLMLNLSSSEEVDVEGVSEDPLPQSPQYEELLEVVTRAVAKLKMYGLSRNDELQKS
ncbi:hypothetical protein Q8A67_017283 [Cirrhinus molitorella]|uniref:Uncharacterized protein n=1 Tax=Cirrhinus molitorella TaxID=172907 RepID=A0AA88TRJ5_9TELE|nr:hypothetical protein Q8A67_017283 [Cirrhinus molitorella]